MIAPRNDPFETRPILYLRYLMDEANPMSPATMQEAIASLEEKSHAEHETMTHFTRQCQSPGCPHEAVTLPLCRAHLAAQGGNARARKLTPERRKEIAVQARQSRKPRVKKLTETD